MGVCWPVEAGEMDAEVEVEERSRSAAAAADQLEGREPNDENDRVEEK